METAFAQWAESDGLAARAARAIDPAVLESARAAGYARDREDYYLNITYPSLQMMHPIDAPTVSTHLQNFDNRPIAAYVHVPFCSAQCAYCHYFKIFRPSEDLTDHTVAAIVGEMAAVAQRIGTLQYRAIYFGGGTPSYLPVAALGRLFNALDTYGTRLPGCEVSFEVHPENASRELFRALKSFGVTRISLGVESLDDRLLLRENRRHSAEQALLAHELAHTVGFDTVNLDLIYGMEQQQVTDWVDTIKTVKNLGPDSLTAYQLRVRTHTAALNRFRRSPDVYATGEESVLMHAISQQGLVEEGGYEETPVDWYIKTGSQHHEYQTLNWRDSDEVPLVGFGPSAYSYIDGLQYYNINDVEQYIVDLRADTLPVFRGEALDHDERWRRSCVLGLKMGLDMPAIQATHGDRVAELVRELVAEPVRLGLVTDRDGWLRLTREGALIADEVARCFASQTMKDRAAAVPAGTISTTSQKLNPHRSA